LYVLIHITEVKKLHKKAEQNGALPQKQWRTHMQTRT